MLTRFVSAIQSSDRAQSGCVLSATQNRCPVASIISAFWRASLNSFSMSLMPVSERNRKVIPSAAVRPDLVVMLMTPFAARAP